MENFKRVPDDARFSEALSEALENEVEEWVRRGSLPENLKGLVRAEVEKIVQSEIETRFSKLLAETKGQGAEFHEVLHDVRPGLTGY